MKSFETLATMPVSTRNFYFNGHKYVIVRDKDRTDREETVIDTIGDKPTIIASVKNNEMISNELTTIDVGYRESIITKF